MSNPELTRYNIGDEDMAQSRVLGKLAEFQAGTDSVDEYVDRFKLYCTANDVADNDKQRAIFLTTVGATTYRLLCNLTRPEKPQDKTLDEPTELMKNHCEPKTIVIAERFRFYKRVQKEGENVASYLAELRRLSKKCDFRDYLNIALRDQFVCGLYFEAAQQKMLAESELGLDKAISMAQPYESARRESSHHVVRHHGVTRRRCLVSKAAVANHNECQRCDGRGHTSDKCRFRTYTCRFCNVKGHIAKACRKKKQNEKETLPRHAKGGQRMHHIEEAEVSTIHTLSDTKGCPKVTLEVAGRDLELDVDTGASVTVLPRHVYSQYLKHVQLQKSKIALRSYSGQPIRVVGEATVPVR